MELFYKNNDVIISNDFFDSELLVVSFSPLVDEKQVSTKESGFGRSFFQSRKISCVYVIPTWNHWYQYEYVSDALEVIRLLSRKFKKVVVYGVSMGGYAALKYANYLNSSAVISISPQAAITGDRSEFDKRFSKFWDKIEYKSDAWLFESNQPINTTVFYDKYHSLDNEHAEIISRHIKHAKMIGLPFSGHEVFAVLNESGILSDFIYSLMNGSADFAKLLRLYRNNRHKSGVTWMYAAQNSLARGRGEIARRLYQKSVNVIEWRKKEGLNIDSAKAKMTLMAYVVYCLQKNDFDAFLDVYRRFSDNKIIKVDLRIKYFEYCVLNNDKSAFLVAYKTYKESGKTAISPVKEIVSSAIKNNLVAQADLA